MHSKQQWFNHLIETHYYILKFINDHEGAGLFDTSGFVTREIGNRRISVRHAQRVIAVLKADGLILGQGKFRITDRGRRVLNLEKMFQDKAQEMLN